MVLNSVVGKQAYVEPQTNEYVRDSEAVELDAGEPAGRRAPQAISGCSSRTDSGEAASRDRADQTGGKEDGLTKDWSFADELEAVLPDLRAFARSLCKEASLADDIVQDTCLKAWSCIDQYDQSRELRPWLFRILRNEFYQHKRRNWRLVDADIEPLMSEMSVDADQPHLFDAGVALRAIDTLSAEQKDAFILVVAAGFTYEEAGEICGCAAGTVKSRVNRARTALQTLLQSRNLKSEIDAIAPSSFDALLEQIETLSRPGGGLEPAAAAAA